jgi:hypothetical protein
MKSATTHRSTVSNNSNDHFRRQKSQAKSFSHSNRPPPYASRIFCQPGKLSVSQVLSNLVLPGWHLPAYCPGVTTVVVVEVGGGAGSLRVVVRLTVVVVVVGGGVGAVTTSSCVQAPKQAAAPITTMRRDNVFI